MKLSGHGWQGRARLTLDAGLPSSEKPDLRRPALNKIGHVAHGHITFVDFAVPIPLSTDCIVEFNEEGTGLRALK
jgi:hypothetical protein